MRKGEKPRTTAPRVERKPGEALSVRDYDWRAEWLRIVWRHRGLTDGAKVIASALADHLNMVTGELYPGATTLADETGRTIRAQKKAIDDLRDARLLTWVPGSGRTSSVYTLLIPALEGGTGVPPCPEHTCHAARHVLALRAERHGKGGGTGVPPNLESNHERTLAAVPAVGVAAAPAALSWQPVEPALRAKMGDDAFDAYLGNGHATLLLGPPAQIVIRKALFAAHVRKKFAGAFTEVFREGWEVAA